MNDLGSFWAMMNIEVGKIREQFELVEKYRENNWKEVPKVEKNNLPPIPTPRTMPLKPRHMSANSKNGVTRPMASATPRARPNVKDFLAARRRELADSQNNDNNCNGEATMITTQ